MRDLFDIILIAVTITCMIVLVSTFAHSHEDGHMEYDIDCCNLQDCAPVTEMKSTPEGDIMTSKFGTVLVPKDIKQTYPNKVRHSKDSRYHVCMRKFGTEADMSLLCVYYPALY